ncbi:MAG: response regulator [Flavobacteriales bacterium]|nr:response regulator [Flavobacteriales bacterium]
MKTFLIYSSVYKLVLLTFLFVSTTSQLYSQSNLNESEIKSGYLINFLKELTFNDGLPDTLYIVSLEDKQVSKTLSVLLKDLKIQNKTVFVGDINLEAPSLLYTTESNPDKIKEIGFKYKSSIIVGNVPNDYFDVYFQRTTNDIIIFFINDKRLKNKNIEPSPQLLVYNANKQETLDLIEEQQLQLEKILEDQKVLMSQLSVNKAKLSEITSEIKEKESDLQQINLANLDKSKQLDKMKEDIHAKEIALNKLKTQYLLSENQLEEILNDLNSKNTSIGKLSDSIYSLQTLLNQKLMAIEQTEEKMYLQQGKLFSQEQKLVDSSITINRNRFILIIVIICLILITISTYFFYKENQQKKAALKLVKEQNIKINSASLQKDEFISNLSHEVRSPLNAILGYSNLLRNTIDDPETNKNLDYIIMSSENLLGIINDILDYRKIEAGKGSIEHKVFDLKEELTVAFNTLRITAETKGLEYNLNINNNVPEFVNSDSKKINQILINLLSNAIKFTDKGIVTLTVECLFKGSSSSTIRLSVTDSGVGIDSNNQKIIFDSFTQETETTYDKYGGSGLGLSISQKLAQLLGSEINVNSLVGKGSEFFFIIELDNADKPTLISNNQKLPKHELSGVRILFADDLAINRNLIEKQFKEWGCAECIKTVSDGNEALIEINKNSYDLLLTDIRMPIMNGIQLTKILRNQKNQIPIIGISAGNTPLDKEECLVAGMNSFMVKPYSFNKLITEISLTLNINNETDSVDDKSEHVFDLSRLRDISENEEEFLELKSNLLKEINNELTSLVNTGSIEIAHQIVNKSVYFGNNNLLNICRNIEAELRSGNKDKALLYSSQALKILANFAPDFKENK